MAVDGQDRRSNSSSNVINLNQLQEFLWYLCKVRLMFWISKYPCNKHGDTSFSFVFIIVGVKYSISGNLRYGQNVVSCSVLV